MGSRKWRAWVPCRSSAQETGRFCSAETCFGVVEVGEQADATLIIGLAVQRWTYYARRALHRTPSRQERGRPRSSAASEKLCRSATRVKTPMASNRSIVRHLRMMMANNA
ncbi:hypothetical protein SAMN02927900_01540 [Rhizobium mongolense subsp. loessense]|uniref:Uncharacterized protein n=1 Tax=Rhizobium mongolense subsp. loessense TaxID=158890 RepID=A0A1G4QA12_9HYPH|nr:hypothetical protein SAMN02927900_01540 [Rhizobium mongolense subsp. loessense]